MQSLAANESRVSWTWADLLCTYRYWGLFLAFVFCGAATMFHYSFIFELANQRGLTFADMAQIQGFARLIAILCALILAWIGIRTRPVAVLLAVTGLGMAASLVLLVPAIPIEAGAVFEGFAVPLMSGVFYILFPVVLARAGGGYQSVLIGFGLAWTVDDLFESAMTAGNGWLINRAGMSASLWVMLVLLTLAIVFLLPVKRELFTIDPPERGSAFVRSGRDPVVTAILAGIVPFYIVYWLYQIHGEEAYLRPSRRLLSPRAAAWLGVIPVVNELLFPFVASTLADHHNEVSAEAGGGRVQRPWAAFLWGLLFVPVSVGLVQSSFNQLAERMEKAGAGSRE